MSALQERVTLPSTIEAGGKTFRQAGGRDGQGRLVNREDAPDGAVIRAVWLDGDGDPRAEAAYFIDDKAVLLVDVDYIFATVAHAAAVVARVTFEWREAFGITWLTASTGDAIAVVDGGMRLYVCKYDLGRRGFWWCCGVQRGDAKTADNAMRAAARALRSPRPMPRALW